MFLADALRRAYLTNGNENGDEFKTINFLTYLMMFDE